MSHHSALEYIRAAREYGLADHEIHAGLAGAGWFALDIRDAFVLAGKLDRPDTATFADAPAMAMPSRPSAQTSLPTAQPTVQAHRTSSVKWTLWLVALIALFFIGYSVMR